MPYNTLATAKAIIGQDLTQDQLDVAKSIIDTWTPYRWASTTITETISGDGENCWLELRPPIISISSFTIDDVSQTDGTDYEIRKIEGMIRCYSGLPWGHDNIVITYVYGWQSSDAFYSDTFSSVKWAESQIALYVKKNPLMLRSASVEGLSINYDDDHLTKLLCKVPKPINFVVMGPSSLISQVGKDI